VFIFIFAVSNYGVGSLLSVNTYPVEVFIQFSTFFKEGRATATAVPVICLAILLLLFQYRLMHGRPYVSFSSAASSPMTLRLGPLRWVVFLGMVAILLFSVLLPVFALVIESGGIAAYRIALATSWRPIVESVALAAAVATVTVCIAFPIAYGLERHRGSLNELMRLIIFIPFAVPGTVYGIGLIRLWNRPGLDVVYSSWAILVIAMLARFCSFAVLILVSSIQQVDIQLDEAACMADVPWHRRLWQILLPINRPGLLIAWFVIFVLTVGELGTTLLVAPPGHEMLSVKIYSLMHYGANELVAALCVILILIGLILLGLINLLLKRQRGNGR